VLGMGNPADPSKSALKTCILVKNFLANTSALVSEAQFKVLQKKQIQKLRRKVQIQIQLDLK
jgi:hypothetical protein